MDPSEAIKKFGKTEKICQNNGKLYCTPCKSFVISGMEQWNLKLHFKTKRHAKGKLQLKASEAINKKIEETFAGSGDSGKPCRG